MAYNGISPYLYKNSVSTVDTFDDISGSFNGSTSTFNITVGGASYTRLTAKACLIVLGGIVQEAGIDYTINAGQIIFTTAPVSGLSFEGRHLFGLNGVDTPTSGSVYPSTLSAGGPSWDTSGNVSVSGNLTVNGSTTTINSTTLSIDDKNIVIADGVSTLANLDTAGIDFGSTNVRLRYNYNGGTNSGLSIEGTNVGIGISSPTTTLDVAGNARLHNSTSNTNRKLELRSTQGYSGFIQFTEDNIADRWSLGIANGDGGFIFKTGADFTGTERLRITSAGLVGIGTSSPGSFAANSLVVEKATTAGITISESTGGGSAVLAFAATSSFDNKARIFSEVANANLKFATAGSTAMTIDASQRVGIGTTNPYSKLGLQGDITLGLSPAPGNSYGRVSWRYNNSSSFGAAGYIDVVQVAAGNSGHMIFATNNNSPDTAEATERLRISSSGNVGIGTTNPTEKLHVRDGRLLVETGGSSTYGVISGFPNNNHLQTFRANITGSTNSPTFTAGHQMCFVEYAQANDSTGWFFKTSATDTYDTVFKISRSNITYPSGNFGIGTDNPTEKLEVSSATASGANISLVKQNSGTANQAGQQLHFYNYAPSNTARAIDTECGLIRFFASQPTSGAAQEMARITAAADVQQTGAFTQGRLTFSTRDATTNNLTERVRIDSSGRVTMPYQPAFFATSTNGNTTVAGNTVIPFNLTSTQFAGNNRNSGYSTLTSAYTVPVSGLYLFGCTLFYYNGTWDGQIVWRKNGAQLSYYDTAFAFAVQSPPLPITLSGSVIMELSANDFIQVANRNGGATITYYGGHSAFWGFLIG